jgi:D-sedoheptulose 7-phosphate isomerase
MDQIQTYLEALQSTLEKLPVRLVENVIEILDLARLSGRKIFILGNGGSASTASHFVCDLAKNTRKAGWPDFRVIGLADNMAIFSALANDEGYEQVFARQLASLVEPGDIVIGISTSGNSPNVLRAMEVARRQEATTIAFTGFDGGPLGELVDIHLHVPSDCIEHVEDIHLILEHMITKALRERRMQSAILDQAIPVGPQVALGSETGALE